MEGRTRADANSVRQRVHSIYCDNSCCEPFILGLALNAGRALHQGAAVLLHEVDRQRCSHLHHNRPVTSQLSSTYADISSVAGAGHELQVKRVPLRRPCH